MPTIGGASLRNDLTTLAEEQIRSTKRGIAPRNCRAIAQDVPSPFTMARHASASAGFIANRNRPRKTVLTPRVIHNPERKSPLGYSELWEAPNRGQRRGRLGSPLAHSLLWLLAIGHSRVARQAVASTAALNAFSSFAVNSIAPALALAIACSPLRAPTSA